MPNGAVRVTTKQNADTSRRRCSTLTSFRDRGLNTAPSAVIDLRHDAFAESFSQIPRSQTSLQTGRAERSWADVSRLSCFRLRPGISGRLFFLVYLDVCRCSLEERTCPRMSRHCRMYARTNTNPAHGSLPGRLRCRCEEAREGERAASLLELLDFPRDPLLNGLHGAKVLRALRAV